MWDKHSSLLLNNTKRFIVQVEALPADIGKNSSYLLGTTTLSTTTLSINTFSIMTLSINKFTLMTLSIVRINIKTFSKWLCIKALNIMSHSIKTISIKRLHEAIHQNVHQNNNKNVPLIIKKKWTFSIEKNATLSIMTTLSFTTLCWASQWSPKC